MVEISEIPQDSTQAIMAWKGAHGVALGNHIKNLGLPPSRKEADIMYQIFSYVDTGEDAAEEHLKLLKNIGGKEIVLLRDGAFPDLSVRYRASIKGNSEGISTLEFMLDGKPIFHARFMCFRYQDQSCLAVVALQRYTDEKMSTTSKPFYKSSDLENLQRGELVDNVPPLKDSNPERYSEYQRETGQIKNFEKKNRYEITRNSCGNLHGFSKGTR